MVVRVGGEVVKVGGDGYICVFGREGKHICN